MSDPKKVVLAYSGGLDTSVILRWLIERYRCEVVAFCADLGQGEELLPIREKALRTGAVGVHIVDLRQEFVRDFIFPMLRANAVYEGSYLLGTSIARPLIARAQVDVARHERADAVAHGATGKGNDQVRFELTYAALAPELTVIAPWREWDMKGRADLIAYAEQHRIPVAATAEKPYSSDRNLLHVSYEGGLLEPPGGTVLRAAFQAVESLTLDREVLHLRDALVPRYAEMVYYGYWFAPERVMLQAAIDEAARAVTGTARLRLYRGSVRVVGRKAPRSLYDPKLVSFDEAGGYRQEDAGGVLRLSGLRLRIQALVERTRQPRAQ